MIKASRFIYFAASALFLAVLQFRSSWQAWWWSRSRWVGQITGIWGIL